MFDKAVAAEALSTSERRIDELRRSGEVNAVRDDRELEYTAAELQRYVDSLAENEPQPQS